MRLAIRPVTFKKEEAAMTLRSALFVGVAICVLLVSESPRAAPLLIDTTASWDGSGLAGWFGESSIATFGQTFTISEAQRLLNFSFWLRDNEASGTAEFVAMIAAWNGAVLGPNLYTSSPFEVTKQTFSEFFFVTQALMLQPGTYVALVSASALFDGVDGIAAVGYTGQDVCSAGFGGIEQGCGFVFIDNATDLDKLSTLSWSQSREDLAFTARFAPVPEPSPFVLFVLGLIVVVGASWFSTTGHGA